MTTSGFLPLMQLPAPDTAERKRREMKAIPLWLPPPKEKPVVDEHPDSDRATRSGD